MPEFRRRPRLRVGSVAFINTKTGNPIACRIKDRSPDGARLFVDSILGIPDRFRLVVQKTGEELPVTVVWRGPQEIGVAFVEQPGAPILSKNMTVLAAAEIAQGGDMPECRTGAPSVGIDCEG